MSATVPYSQKLTGTTATTSVASFTQGSLGETLLAMIAVPTANAPATAIVDNTGYNYLASPDLVVPGLNGFTYYFCRRSNIAGTAPSSISTTGTTGSFTTTVEVMRVASMPAVNPVESTFNSVLSAGANVTNHPFSFTTQHANCLVMLGMSTSGARNLSTVTSVNFAVVNTESGGSQTHLAYLADAGAAGPYSTTINMSSATPTNAIGVVYKLTDTPTVSLNPDASATEGSAVTHNVTLSATTTATEYYSVSLQANGTASTSDFTSLIASATFGSSGVTYNGSQLVVPSAVLSFPITIATTQDLLNEFNETYTLTVGGIPSIGTIIDNDPIPTFTVSDATESFSSTSFKVDLNVPSGRTVLLNYSTADGSKLSGVDYAGVSGQLSYLAGDTSRTVVVPTGIAPPPAVVYGASDDAWQINTSDSITGTRYYFNAITGNDTNPGTSSGSPAQTLAKLYDYSTTGGSLTAPTDSAFMLARGSTFLGLLNFDNTSFGNYLVGASGTGSRPRIKSKQTATLSSANDPIVWCNRTGPKMRNLSLDGQCVFRAAGTAGTGTLVDGDVVTGVTSGASGTFQYSVGGTYVIALKNLTKKFVSGETIQTSGGAKTATIASLTYPGGVWFKAATWEISNSDISNTTGDGVVIGTSGTAGSGDNATITNTLVRNTGLLQTNGAGINGGLGANIQVTNTSVVNCGGSGNAASSGISLTDVTATTIARNYVGLTANRGNQALVMRGVCATVTIEDNLFEKFNNGVAISDGLATAESFNNFTIRRNISRLHGSLYGQTQGKPFELACLTNSAVYNNVSDSTNGAYTLAAKLASGGSDTTSASVTISHETLYNVLGGMVITGAVTGITLQNSILMSTATSGLLLTVDVTAAAAVTLRNCLFYMPNNTGNVISWAGTLYTLAGFLAGPGAGKGLVVGNPQFLNPENGDFRVASASPAKSAGYAAGITTDLYTLARNMTTPTIGAVE